MFNIDEIKDKILMYEISNGMKISDTLKSNKSIYLVNNRTHRNYKFVFVKQNGYSYRVDVIFDDDREDTKYKLSTSGKITHIVLDSVISMSINDNILKIAAPSDFLIFE